MNGAEILLKTLEHHGIDTVFGYPGGAILPIYDALAKQNKIRHILVRHEQAAVHAAEGYARSTGKLGVVFVTSGPGATNAVTGLADAYMDGIPVLCISGQVATHLIGTDAFQEADIVGITRPITKHNYLVKDSLDLCKTIHDAIRISMTGRPGPTLIDIPKDIQLKPSLWVEPIDYVSEKPEPLVVYGANSFDEAVIKSYEMLRSAHRPIIYAGGGMISGSESACLDLIRLAEVMDIPVTNTLLGLGAMPADHPLFLGMLGMHGTLEANLAMHGCDVMLALSARFDDRITGRVRDFSPNSQKIHVDIARHNIGKVIPVQLGILSSSEEFLSAILKYHDSLSDSKKTLASKVDWHTTINNWKAKKSLSYDQSLELDSKIIPQHAVASLGIALKNSGKDYFVTTDVGQHQMWTAQHIPFNKPRRWMTSGGLGTMGYGLPAAVGVQIAHPDSLVICVSGDASIQMNIQELATIREQGLSIKTFIINNGCMGMVRQWQDMHHGQRKSQSVPGFQPDFIKLAEAYDIKGYIINNIKELNELLPVILSSPYPCLVDIRVENMENCYPMIPSGAAHNEVILGPENISKT